MDKRWRNLGIIVAVIIVLALAVVYVPTLDLSNPDNASFSDGEDKIESYF